MADILGTPCACAGWEFLTQVKIMLIENMSFT